MNPNDIFSVGLEEGGYPASLKMISDPPSRLFCCGRRELLSFEPRIAVIGSRDPSPYGVAATKEVVRDLAGVGICIVSGLARGIDGLAHEAALSAGGKTIAVLGTAIDSIYPRENIGLAGNIIKEGLIVSEHPPGFKEGQPWHFAVRNRIISGLCMGVIVIEARVKSGTQITVDYALEQSREVFALPGPIGSETSEGTLKLLREGARMVRSARDVLEDLGLAELHGRPQPERKQERSGRREETNDPVLVHLDDRPVHIDTLLEKTGFSVADLSRTLMGLELEGKVRKVAGQRYVRG